MSAALRFRDPVRDILEQIDVLPTTDQRRVLEAFGSPSWGSSRIFAAPTLPNPYTTPEIERDRAACLERGGVWIETVDRYVCRAISRGEPS